MEFFVLSAMTGYSAVSAYNFLSTPPVIVPNSKYSPYNIFVKERFKEIKENCPDIESKEILKIIAIKWKMKKEGF
jgi:hypothetical protein